MENLLPIVDPEIGHSIAQSMDDDENRYLKKQLKRIEKENPTIAEFISRWAITHKKDGKDAMHAIALCGILVYRLLESQAESDKMDEEIKLN